MNAQQQYISKTDHDLLTRFRLDNLWVATLMATQHMNSSPESVREGYRPPVGGYGGLSASR